MSPICGGDRNRSAAISLLQAQKDTLTGGSGNDAFVFNASFGKVVISDFDVNHDQLLMSSSLFSNATSGAGARRRHAVAVCRQCDLHDTHKLT